MENTLQNSKDRLFIKLNSFVVAMMISAQTITGTIVRIPAFKDFHNNFIILVIALTIIFAEIIYYKKVTIELPVMFFLSFVTLWYLYSLIFHGNNCDLNVIQFIFYAIIPIYVIGKKLDGELVMRYILYLSLMTLPVINLFFVLQYVKYNQAYMGNIYAILSPVIVAMIHFKLYRKQSNLLIKLTYIYNLYIMVKIVLFANRGAVLCLACCDIVLVINSYDDDKRKKLSAIKLSLIIVFSVIGILIIIFALPLLHSLADLCNSILNSVPSFISKMIKYLELGDVSDGRTAIDAFTLPAIANNPIFGYGIETFSKVSGELANRSWPYPHQYIYQYLFEGGIVFGLIPVYSSLSLTAKVVCTRIKDKSEFALCCTLVCVTLPKLLISTEPWATTSIWMLITYSLIYICKTNPIFISLNQSFCSRRK
ncbi:MAG: O-antigen ligase family protein [Ruminococcus bromii]